MSEPKGDVGKRLAISGGVAESRTAVSLYDLDGHGGRRMLSDVMAQNAEKLSHFLCAECVHCPRMKPSGDQFKDHKDMNMVVSTRATCDLRGGECPDGFSINERGWRSGVETADMTSYGDHSARRVVTGYKYSEVSPDPLTMNHLTISQRCRQFDELARDIQVGAKPGRVDQTSGTTTIEMSGRVVKLHRQSGKIEAERGESFTPAEMTITWPKGGHTWPSSFEMRSGQPSQEEFRREYFGDFSGNVVKPYIPAPPPKDVPSSPDTGTW